MAADDKNLNQQQESIDQPIRHKYLMSLYRRLGLLKPARDVKEVLHFGIETLLPAELKVSRANALFISGWCFHTTRKIKRLEIAIGDHAQVVKTIRQARRDILERHFPELDPRQHSYQSGFWTILTFPPLNESVRATISLKAALDDGRQCVETVDTILLKADR